MEILSRPVSGLAAALASLLAPVGPVVAVTVLFIFVDFLSGVAADRAVALREGRTWFFESRKAWRTVVKASLAVAAVVMGWLVESCIMRTAQVPMARPLAGFICGVEFWSFIENAASITQSELFRHLNVKCNMKEKG